MDRALRAGDEIDGLTALPMPGHSPGSCAFYERATGRLFSGDACLTKKAVPGAGTRESPLERPNKLFSWDLERAEHSLARLADLPITGVYPGHGPPYVADPEDVRQAVRTLLMIY